MLQEPQPYLRESGPVTVKRLNRVETLIHFHSMFLQGVHETEPLCTASRVGNSSFCCVESCRFEEPCLFVFAQHLPTFSTAFAVTLLHHCEMQLPQHLPPQHRSCSAHSRLKKITSRRHGWIKDMIFDYFFVI